MATILPAKGSPWAAAAARQSERGRSQSREAPKREAPRREAPRNEGSLDAQAERRLSGTDVRVLDREFARAPPLHPFSSHRRWFPRASLLRSCLPGRGHGGLCATTTGEPRGLWRCAPARWGGPPAPRSLSEEDPTRARRAVTRPRGRQPANPRERNAAAREPCFARTATRRAATRLGSARDKSHGRGACAGRSWRWPGRWVAIRSSTDETPRPAAGHPLERKMRLPASRVSQGRQRAAQRRGLGSARDKLHGRVVMRRSVVEMAQTVGRNTAVDGRATGPDPRRKQACTRSPERCASAQILCDTGRCVDQPLTPTVTR